VYFTTCMENFLDFDVKWQKSGAGPSAGERKALLQQVLAHRDALLIEWETKVQPA